MENNLHFLMEYAFNSALQMEDNLTLFQMEGLVILATNIHCISTSYFGRVELMIDEKWDFVGCEGEIGLIFVGWGRMPLGGVVLQACATKLAYAGTG